VSRCRAGSAGGKMKFSFEIKNEYLVGIIIAVLLALVLHAYHL
jgi:hypothetical protein